MKSHIELFGLICLLILSSCADDSLVVSTDEQSGTTVESASLTINPQVAHFDEKISISADSLQPNKDYTLHLYTKYSPSSWGHSSVTYRSDASGKIDITTAIPLSGSYKSVSPMGLFWSIEYVPNDNFIPNQVADSMQTNLFYITIEKENTVCAVETFQYSPLFDSIENVDISNDDFTASLYKPKATPEKIPAILILHGTGGAYWKDYNYAYGIANRTNSASVVIPYFGIEGLPQELDNIPLEYFEKCISYLQSLDYIDSEKIGVIGFSRGGELALLLASKYPEIKLAISYVGSGYIGNGFSNNFELLPNAWSYNGEPLLPKDNNNENVEIEVEDINGSVLLISAKDDKIWTSYDLSNVAYNRLRENNFAHPFEHISYENAGHHISVPYFSTMGQEIDGGTAEGTSKANEESWQTVTQLINETF